MHYVYLLLACLGALSPLLTLAYLWQVKEWRFDRMKEHLRAEGLFRPLWGLLRPVILLIVLVAAIADVSRSQQHILLGSLALALFSGVQIALQRQPLPVWTQKAIALVTLGMLINIIGVNVSVALTDSLFPYLLCPFVQPLVLVLAWVILYPEDQRRKQRIMKRAQAIRQAYPDLQVIGITGSVGKTTTKELLDHVLKDLDPLTTPVHVNSEMGVSQWLIRELGSKQKVPGLLVVEMGAYRMGEISLLCDIVQPTVGIITFIGTQHIALFGSQENLCQAKGELVEAIPEHGLSILNADSAACANVRHRAKSSVVTIGTDAHADLKASEIEETTQGIRFRAGQTQYDVPLHGTHNVTNVLLTIAAARHMGLSDQDIANKLRTFTPPERTFTVREDRGVQILDDTHNASPASFKAAIDWARTQPAKERVLITSGLIELGQAQDRIHAELGNLCRHVFDRCIFLSKKHAKAFEQGYGKPVEILQKHTKPVSPDSLMICEGRMSEKTIQSLLPHAT